MERRNQIPNQTLRRVMSWEFFFFFDGTADIIICRYTFVKVFFLNEIHKPSERERIWFEIKSMNRKLSDGNQSAASNLSFPFIPQHLSSSALRLSLVFLFLRFSFRALDIILALDEIYFISYFISNFLKYFIYFLFWRILLG